jgi:REP element-mobilizing transposase RayT
METTDITRRHLPHLAPAERGIFVTFCTIARRRLPPGARSITLRHMLWGHRSDYFVHVAVVMPDHAHMVLTLTQASLLSKVMKSIKGVSSRRINKLLGSTGNLWQDESFDHVIRRSEGLRQKCEYIARNPVRAGLATRPDDYTWLWRAGVEGRL